MFYFSPGLGDLWGQLRQPHFSTIIYAMSDVDVGGMRTDSADTDTSGKATRSEAATTTSWDGLCAMATELSGWQRKRVLFWPCYLNVCANNINICMHDDVKHRIIIISSSPRG